MSRTTSTFRRLKSDISGCQLCAQDLKHGVRPVAQFHPSATVLIAGQAPGVRVHKSGIPFDDASGERLREWMGVDRNTFYDESRIAILPMGFCYPGSAKSGDLPPRPVCAATWRERVLAELPDIRLTLAIGLYAQNWHIDQRGKNLTETVRQWKRYGPALMPLPHPSPRNNIWLKKNPWFEQDALPALKRRVARVLG